jgi:beta-lactamase regulating signal transducer with metallopeptidase domain
MFDLSIKLAGAAAIAWLATRRITPANAAAAHRVWASVAFSPLVWLAAGFVLPSVLYIQPRAGSLPAQVIAPLERLWPVAIWTYACVLGVLLARVLYGIVAVNRLIRQSARVPPTEIQRVLPDVTLTVGIRESLLAVPVTAGFLRPVIVLPASWREIPAAGLRAILLHEAAHVRRRDSLVTLACAVLEAVFWFHPAMWFAASRVRWFAELASDADAAGGMAPGDYAAELLFLAAGWNERRGPSYAITAGMASGVTRRIRLLADEMEQGTGPRRLLLATLAIVFGMMTLGSALRLDSGSTRLPFAVADDGDHDRIHQLRHRH